MRAGRAELRVIRADHNGSGPVEPAGEDSWIARRHTPRGSPNQLQAPCPHVPDGDVHVFVHALPGGHAAGRPGRRLGEVRAQTGVVNTTSSGTARRERTRPTHPSWARGMSPRALEAAHRQKAIIDNPRTIRVGGTRRGSPARPSPSREGAAPVRSAPAESRGRPVASQQPAPDSLSGPRYSAKQAGARPRKADRHQPLAERRNRQRRRRSPRGPVARHQPHLVSGLCVPAHFVHRRTPVPSGLPDRIQASPVVVICAAPTPCAPTTWMSSCIRTAPTMRAEHVSRRGPVVRHKARRHRSGRER